MSIATYILTQMNTLMKDLCPIIESLEGDLNKACAELQKKPGSIPHDPAGSGVGQYQLLKMQEIVENGKADHDRGPRDQPDKEHISELKALRNEFKQAFDD